MQAIGDIRAVTIDTMTLGVVQGTSVSVKDGGFNPTEVRKTGKSNGALVFSNEASMMSGVVVGIDFEGPEWKALKELKKRKSWYPVVLELADGSLLKCDEMHIVGDINYVTDSGYQFDLAGPSEVYSS